MLRLRYASMHVTCRTEEGVVSFSLLGTAEKSIELDIIFKKCGGLGLF